MGWRRDNGQCWYQVTGPCDQTRSQKAEDSTMMSIFLKIPTIDTHSSPMKARYEMYIMCSKSHSFAQIRRNSWCDFKGSIPSFKFLLLWCNQKFQWDIILTTLIYLSTPFQQGCEYKPTYFLAATKQLYEWFSPSVCPSVRPSVRPSVTPFWLCSVHPVIMKFSGVITSDKSDVHAKGQGQRSKVKVTEVTTQLNRFRTVTPV